MPGGETCVYDIADVGKMTLISPADLEPCVCSPSGGVCSAARDHGDGLLLLLGGLFAGFGRARRRPPGRAA